LPPIENGLLYGCGDGTSGQLGKGEREKRRRLSVIRQLEGVAVRDIACGAQHSVVLSVCGATFAFGSNARGQCGVSGGVDVVTVPTEIESLRRRGIVAVRCGAHHSLAISDSQRAFGWGANNFQQLAVMGDESVLVTPVALPSDNVVDAACGERHTLLLSGGGEVLSCGQGGAGQLGRAVNGATLAACDGELSTAANVVAWHLAAGGLFSFVATRSRHRDDDALNASSQSLSAFAEQFDASMSVDMARVSLLERYRIPLPHLTTTKLRDVLQNDALTRLDLSARTASLAQLAGNSANIRLQWFQSNDVVDIEVFGVSSTHDADVQLAADGLRLVVRFQQPRATLTLLPFAAIDNVKVVKSLVIFIQKKKQCVLRID
jgi:alpha-tubulin suppressor-like RCC1 family protein